MKKTNLKCLDHKYCITTKKRINLFDLIIKLHDKQQNVDFIRKDNTSLIFLPGFSTRGVELLETSDNYYLTMNFLANSYDYKLCNYIAHLICKKWDGILTDDLGMRRRIGKLFNDKKILDYLFDDAQNLFDILKHRKDFEISCPVRPFRIGKHNYDKIIQIKKENYLFDRTEMISANILACQYPPDIFRPCYDLQVEIINNEKVNIAQALSNKHDMVIEKANNYIVSDKENSISIDMTIENIISILPKAWILIDNSTILACKLPNEQWVAFIKEAQKISTDFYIHKQR